MFGSSPDCCQALKSNAKLPAQGPPLPPENWIGVRRTGGSAQSVPPKNGMAAASKP